MIYLLDSDTLSHWHAGHAKLFQRYQALRQPRVATTIITRVEVLRGRIDFLLKAETSADLLRAQEWLRLSEERLAQMDVFPLDQDALQYFEQISRRKGLKKLGRADLLIASIALSRRATLVTRNLRHFRQIPNLGVDNWVD